MIAFILNGAPQTAAQGQNLLEFLRHTKGLTGAKNACSEGVCGACSILVDGKVRNSCLMTVDKVAGASVTTIEGIDAAEMECYARAFAECGAVQCGYCTPGMVMSAKALLDANPAPAAHEVRAAIRRNLCRCTGYSSIIRAIVLASQFRQALSNSALPRGRLDAKKGSFGPGQALLRVDAIEKVTGKALYVDDMQVEGMLHGAVLRAQWPRARLLGLDVSGAVALPGVHAVLTAADIPGDRFIGHLVDDWPTMIALGEESRYVGDAVAVVAADSAEIAKAACAAIIVRWEKLAPITSPKEALASGAAAIHPQGNILLEHGFSRGNYEAAIAQCAHVFEATFTTPFTDHAFLETESALAMPFDSEGNIRVFTGEQNIYDGRRYIAHTLGIAESRVRVTSAFVGGGFGGKEDQTVQHLCALLAAKTNRPVKLTLSRAESTRVHVKRHAMEIALSVGCDANGLLHCLKARIVADTGAYASLGDPVLRRATTHVGGPYRIANIDVNGISVFTNNPPAGAFRGFGVPQVNFAIESAMNILAAKVGISAWEIRMRNAVRPGDIISNGQSAAADTGLIECLEAVKPYFEDKTGDVGIACGFKSMGIGVELEDIGRCNIMVLDKAVEVRCGAACIGQGLATVLTQITCETLDLAPGQVRIAPPDSSICPDCGTTTASRQTLIAGEACRRACTQLLDAHARKALQGADASTAAGAPADVAKSAQASAAPEKPDAASLAGGVPGAQEVTGIPAQRNAAAQASTQAVMSGFVDSFAHPAEFRFGSLAGALFCAEFNASREYARAHPDEASLHVAYSYACHLARLDLNGKVQHLVAAHDSGLVVNPLSFDGQVVGGVCMGIGYALSEKLPMENCVPECRLGKLGLLRSTDMPEVTVIRVSHENAAEAGKQQGKEPYAAKGIGEISTIPTAPAIAGALFARDGIVRYSLPLA